MSAPPSPLIERPGADIFALRRGESITVDTFLRQVRRVACELPKSAALLNACEDRYAFLLAFFAAVLTARPSLLPTSRTAAGLSQAAAAYPGAGTVRDGDVLKAVAANDANPAPVGAGDNDLQDSEATIAGDTLAAVAFTSGTTGQPQPHTKYWAGLHHASRLHAVQLGLGDRPVTLVSTVPPWHMYGLEWSVLLATVAPATLFCDEAFYPGDVARALADHQGGRVLVTTPVHLEALLRSGARLPPVGTVISATAPLEAELARDAERAFKGRLLEIYGCTEVGTIAHRQPTLSPDWQTFPGFELYDDGDRSVVRANFLDASVTLSDRLEIRADGTFRLEGRLGDLVKVAGKRASLEELTTALKQVDGVRDGIFFEPPGGGRLCAIVVAPGLTANAVRRRLAERVDPAFLPRPLRLVDELPRSPTGKVTRSALLALINGSDAGA